VPRAGLTPAAVVDVALALIDEKGLDALSLAAVADRAGVASPSLYKHVGSLADLRELMAERIARQMTSVFASEVMGRSGDEAVVAVMRTWRTYVLNHPARYHLVPLDPLRQGAALAQAGAEFMEVFVAVMRGYGLDDEGTTHAIRRLRAAVHGFASLEAGGGFGMDVDVDESYEQLIDMCVRSLR
jgi:AcrR family transcriptional regulator